MIFSETDILCIELFIEIEILFIEINMLERWCATFFKGYTDHIDSLISKILRKKVCFVCMKKKILFYIFN